MTTPVILTFNVTQFRLEFPEFADVRKFPTPTLQGFWDASTGYVSDIGNYGSLQGGQRQYALNLLTAHIAYISTLIAAGQVPYLMQTSTIDKVAIGLTPPPLKNQWQWWLSVSAYGQKLQALLQNKSVGGFYIGGQPTISAFRGYGPLWY